MLNAVHIVFKIRPKEFKLFARYIWKISINASLYSFNLL